MEAVDVNISTQQLLNGLPSFEMLGALKFNPAGPTSLWCLVDERAMNKGRYPR